MALRKWLWTGLVGVVLLSLLTGCATNPVTGRKEFSLVSAEQEVQIGREGHEAVLREYGAYENPRLQAFVDSVGQSLARVSHLPNLDWHFTVLDDPTVNAFAMPGGYIYITRGIMAHLNSEAQLAGVLGHEIGHVTARHSAKRMTSQQLAGLGLGLASIFSQGFRRYSDAAQTALSLMFLKYSRDNENEADQLGVDYTAKSSYDPREIPATYVTLRRTGERAGQSLPGFLSTHPDPGDRENRTRELARQAVAGKTGLIVRQRAYVQRLEDVVYGTDPRHGYFEGTRFFHPTLGFEMTFPSAWRTQNARAAVVAVSPEDRAGMQLSVANAGALSPAAYVNQLRTAGNIADAQGNPETIGGFQSWVGRILVAASDGSQATLVATFIRKTADQMFQVVGRSNQPGDELESQIVTSARSFRPLTDAARRSPTPDRVHVVSVASSGPFQTVVAQFGRQAIDVEESSILNNVELDETVMRGQVLKIVEPGRRR